MENFVIESDSRTASGNGITVERCSFSHPCPAAEMHIHSSVEVVFLIRGKLEIVTRDNTFFTNPGDLVLFRKYTIHGINVISDEGCEYLSIKFHMSILNDFSSLEDINHYLAFFSIDAKTDAFILQHDELEGGNIVSLIDEIAKTYTDEGIFAFFRLKLKMGNLILAIMEKCYTRIPEQFKPLRYNDSMSRNIKRAIEFANANYVKRISARDAAKVAGLSYNYFSNCFSRVTGMTFTQYVNKVRINHARYQLLITEKSIAVIAEYIGFENSSYFTQEFRRQTGMTPTEYIKKYKKTRKLDG